MAVDWFLIVIVVVMAIALLFANVYVLVYFQHDDDKNTAYFPKALVIFGLLFAEGCVLLLPLDVANNSSAIGCAEGWNTACGNLNMDLLWLIVFMAIIFVIVVLLPYSIYYYEADDGEDNVGNRQWLEALKMEIATLAFVIALFVVLYVTVSKSHIPMRALEVNSASLAKGFHTYTDGATLSSTELESAAGIAVQSLSVTLDVSFPIYITGLVSFIGWFGFCIFCGIGLIALPLDLILSYANRPKFISADVYAHQKASICIQKRSIELIELGKSIRSAMERPGGGNKSSWERKKQKRLDF
ncbi:hypothetical protein PybrP1_003872, partial [[Pythium] brassicae (nom. inval.)]